MTYAARLQQRVLRYTREDRRALIEFQQRTFGPAARQLDERHFKWLFEDNPFNSPDGPQIWVCRSNGSIIGQQAGIPFDLKVGGQYRSASWAIDLMVRPEWRLRGVGAVLSETYVASNDITVGLGISDQAHRAFLRAGWTDMGTVPLYIRPLDASWILKARPSSGSLLRSASAFAAPVLALWDAASEGCTRLRGAALRPVERFDERVDALWAEASGDYTTVARRDCRSLRWRFDALADTGRYERLYLFDGEKLRGYAVVRMAARYGEPVGMIVDYLSGADWLTPLFASSLVYLRRAGAAAVYCTTLNHRADFCLRALGFVRRESSVRFMVRLGRRGSALSEIVSNPRNWFVTAADSDKDHPQADQRPGRTPKRGVPREG